MVVGSPATLSSDGVWRACIHWEQRVGVDVAQQRLGAKEVQCYTRALVGAGLQSKPATLTKPLAL